MYAVTAYGRRRAKYTRATCAPRLSSMRATPDKLARGGAEGGARRAWSRVCGPRANASLTGASCHAVRGGWHVVGMGIWAPRRQYHAVRDVMHAVAMGVWAPKLQCYAMRDVMRVVAMGVWAPMLQCHAMRVVMHIVAMGGWAPTL